MFGLKSKQQKIIDRLKLEDYQYRLTLYSHSDPAIRKYILSRFVEKKNSAAYQEACLFLCDDDCRLTDEEKIQILAMVLNGLEEEHVAVEINFGEALAGGIAKIYLDNFSAWVCALEKNKPGAGANIAIGAFRRGGYRNGDARAVIIRALSRMLEETPSQPLADAVCKLRIQHHNIMVQEKGILLSGLVHVKQFLGKDHIQFLRDCLQLVPQLKTDQADMIIGALGNAVDADGAASFFYVPEMLRSRSGDEALQDGLCAIFERAVRENPEKMGKELHNFLSNSPGLHPRAQARLTRLFAQFRHENMLDSVVMAVDFLKREKTKPDARAPMLDIVTDSKNASARLAFLAANKILVEAPGLEDAERAQMAALAVGALEHPDPAERERAMAACADTIAGTLGLGDGAILLAFVQNLLTQTARTDAAPPEKIKGPKV